MQFVCNFFLQIPNATPCLCAFGPPLESQNNKSATTGTIVAIGADGSYHKFQFDKGTYSTLVYDMFLDIEDCYNTY